MEGFRVSARALSLPVDSLFLSGIPLLALKISLCIQGNKNLWNNFYFGFYISLPARSMAHHQDYQ